MPALKLNVIKPSVNNMAARVFVRAAGLDFAEHDVYGQTRSEEFVFRNPAHMTPMIESDELPALGELRYHAVSLQQTRARRILSQGSGEARDDRQRNVLFDRNALSLCGSGHLSKAQFPAISGGSRPQRRRRRPEGGSAHSGGGRDRRTARCLSTNFYMGGKPFIGGDKAPVSTAPIRAAKPL
jgi:glutathione S-transferase